MIKVTVPSALTGMGQPLQPLAWMAINAGANSHIVDLDTIEYEIREEHSALITLDIMTSIVLAGGNIDKYPCFLKLSEEAYGKEIPEGIPFREIRDEEGNITVRSWKDWNDGNDIHLLLDGNRYIENGSYLRHLTAKELAKLPEGVSIITHEEYRELTKSEEIDA